MPLQDAMHERYLHDDAWSETTAKKSARQKFNELTGDALRGQESHE